MPVEDQGVTKDRYMVIPRTLIFLTRGDRVLLIKGAPDKRLWANRYNGIGGHVEIGEDLLSSARRELFEETQLEPADLMLVGIVMVDTQETTGIGIFIFRGECLQGEGKPSKEGGLEWVELDQVDNLPLVEDLTVLLPRIFAWKKGDAPFFARSFYNDQEKICVVFA